MWQKYLGALIRHSVSGAGVVGVLSDSDAEKVAGAVSILASFLWSLYQKKNTPIS